jgi:tetratricopeptide (TPR) repeat protein
VPDRIERVLVAYEHAVVERLRYVFSSPLARKLMWRSKVRESIAAHYCQAAHTWANKRDYEEAIRACRASIAVQRTKREAHEVLIQVLVHQQRYEEAFDACVDALSAIQDFGNVSSTLRHIFPLVKQDRTFDRAIGVLQKCLAANPVKSDLLIVLMKMLTRSGRRVEAAHVYDRALQADPDSFFAADAIDDLLKDPAAQQVLAKMGRAAASIRSEEYDWLVASNVVETLLGIMAKFYGMIGVDPQLAPLVQGLESSRRELAARQPPPAPDASTVLLFERAWRSHLAGRTQEALVAFEEILNDGAARRRAAHNPSFMEAVVRAGEILGRHYDEAGEVERAIRIYQDVLSLGPNNLVARRLIVLLSRNERMSEAAKLAEIAINSQPNRYQKLPVSPHIDAIKQNLAVGQRQHGV